MPVSSMALIRPIMEEALEALTPDVLEAVRFKRASADCELRLQTFGDRLDGCRRFQVIPGPLAAMGGVQVLNWNGDALRISDVVAVVVRYELATADEAFGQLCDMLATDAQLIVRALHPLLTSYSPAVLHDIAPAGAATLERISADDAAVSAWLVRFPFTLTTSLGDD